MPGQWSRGTSSPATSVTAREGQEDQLGALGLVLNAAVLWTTRYLDTAVEQLRALPADQREYQVLEEDVARLSPLRHANLNVLGRYTFRDSGHVRESSQSIRRRLTSSGRSCWSQWPQPSRMCESARPGSVAG